MVSDMELGMVRRVPAIIYGAMEGKVDLVARLLSDEPLCLGYQPVCGDNPFFERVLLDPLP